MLKTPFGRDVVILSGGLATVALAAALLQRATAISPTTVALAFLLIVLVTATLSRLRIAILVSVVAMLTFNFFFLPPLRTFAIVDPQNWIALFVFFAVAVIASNLSAAVQERAREAIARRNEVGRLFDLTRDVLLTTDTTGAIDAVTCHVARRFDLAKVAVCLPGDRGWRIAQGGSAAIVLDESQLDGAMTRAGRTLESDLRATDSARHVRAGTRGEIAIVPLRHGDHVIGLLLAESSELDIGTLDAIAGVVAIAIERAQFLADRDATELVQQKADLAATLLASLSHDLRTPLTAIKVAIENLRSDLPLEARQMQAAAAAAEIDRLAGLVKDILDMARVDAGAIVINRQWVTPADIIDAAVAHVQHALVKHPLDVEADSENEVEIDPRLTSAALAQLLENAARYSPATEPIHITARTTDAGLSVTVTDRGPGLDLNELEHLFERFYRGRTARQATVGTGMGLSITRGLLAAVRGQVWGENVPGAGARFSIAVPAPVRAVAQVR